MRAHTPRLGRSVLNARGLGFDPGVVSPDGKGQQTVALAPCCGVGGGA
jgi:hypothetical protein